MAKAKKEKVNESMEQVLWSTANKLRKNMDAAEYKHIVSGLIFLKYISDSFTELYNKLKEGEGEYEGADPEDSNEYRAEDVFYVSPQARWEYLQARGKLATIGKDVDDAMDAIEKDNISLKGVLPKEYAKEKLDKQTLGGLIDLIGTIALGDSESRSKDVLGRVYEYFLGQFALAEGKKGGQFYTPSCVVRLLVEMLEPYEGRVFDPCCGSGGMFVQSEKFILAHSDRYSNGNKGLQSNPVDRISIYGQESNQTTWRLCKMNLAIRGIDSSNVKWNNEGSFLNDSHPDLKADFVIANPPFNDKDWSGDLLRTDGRWQYGTPPVGNANYAWIQHFLYHLSRKGTAGFVLAKGSLASKTSGEGNIRRTLIDKGLVDCIVNMPTKLFLNTGIPACLWFLSNDKANGVGNRRNKILFIDARNMGTLINRRNRELTNGDIELISSTYHKWKTESTDYADIAGFCKSTNVDEVKALDYVLTPGRYIGLPQVIMMLSSLDTHSLKSQKNNLRMRLSYNYWFKLYKEIFKRHTKSIKSRLTILFLLTLPVSITLVGVYFYFVLSSMITDNINRDLLQIIQQVNSKVESCFTMINQESMILFSNQVIKNDLKIITSEEDAYLKVTKRREIENELSISLLENYTMDSKLFSSAYIFKDKTTFYYYERYFEANLFKNNLSIFEEFCRQKEAVKIFPPSVANQSLYLAKKIVDLNRNDVYGTIILGVEESLVEKVYADDLSLINAQMYIYDNNGIILSCKDKGMLGKKVDNEFYNLIDTKNIQKQLINGEEYFVALNKFNNFDLVSVTLISEREILSKLSKSIRIYLYIILAAVTISVVLGFLISYIFVKPIDDLILNLNMFKKGDFTVKMPNYKYYELNELSIVFNKMTNEIQHLFNQVYEKQMLLKESELKSLQSQVNPHFLFNVLNTISWEAMASNNRKIYKMIVSLSHLLRANINKDTADKLIIGEEIKYIEFYLYLQEMRFGKKLSTNINIIDESIKDFYIPKFSIQTIVENAIIHGLENKIGERNLQIVAFRESETIVFEVIDDGVGFDVNKINIIDNNINDYNKSNHESFGLYNVNKRIKFFYGEEYGLKIQSKINEGAKVTIRIPLDRGEKL